MGQPPNIISTISIHIYSLHFRALEHKGLDSHPNFMEWPPKFAEWHVLQSDCLFFPVFFPHLAIKIPWGSLKCDLCGSWCGCITAAEFARFTPFQQAAQWPWLRSERSERSECRCQGTPPLKSTWKQPPDREKCETCAETSTMSCFGCMFDIVRLHEIRCSACSISPATRTPFARPLT